MRRDWDAVLVNAYFVAGAIGLALLMVALVLLGVAAGAPLPPFPFQNLQQLGSGIPDFEAVGVAEYPCNQFHVFLFQFKQTGGKEFWQVFVQNDGPNWTAAFYPEEKGNPTVVYFGTVNEQNGRMTLQHSEAFDPAKHQSLCETWK